MKRSDLDQPKLNPNFIGSWVIASSLCDEIIDYYEKNKQKQMKGGTSEGINLKIKDRQDISLSPKDLKLPENEVFQRYFENLFQCYRDYNIQWPFLASMISNLEIGSFNIGKYTPGQHFQKMHCERTSLNTLHRLFAFMTYLNDVDDGGSTYFNHYDLEIKPKSGLTILWPAEWTHSHKGNILKSGLKYIITGWLIIAK